MNKQELKHFLESYMFDEQYLKEKVKEVEKIKLQTEKILNSNNIANKSSSIIDTQHNEQQIILEIYLKKQKIESLFQLLEQPYRTLMYLKYISFLTFDQVADRMNYSTKRIYQLHNEGLNFLQLKINNEEISLSTN